MYQHVGTQVVPLISNWQSALDQVKSTWEIPDYHFQSTRMTGDLRTAAQATVPEMDDQIMMLLNPDQPTPEKLSFPSWERAVKTTDVVRFIEHSYRPRAGVDPQQAQQALAALRDAQANLRTAFTEEGLQPTVREASLRAVGGGQQRPQLGS
jgi:hypothetical protein